MTRLCSTEITPTRGRLSKRGGLAEHSAAENILARSHQDAVAKVREANEKKGWLGADLLKAREELGRLEFQERQLRAPGRGPEPAEVRGAVGQLSRVG